MNFIRLTAKRVSDGDPVNSYTYRTTEVREFFPDLLLINGRKYLVTYDGGATVVMSCSRSATTLYSGVNSKHVTFTTPKLTGDEVLHKVKTIALIPLKVNKGARGEVSNRRY